MRFMLLYAILCMAQSMINFGLLYFLGCEFVDFPTGLICGYSDPTVPAIYWGKVFLSSAVILSINTHYRSRP